ncbi:MAG: hypothetical protein CME65_06310 [Halobacteriovoraceae bacterium]|nr:hypothetical protein [Halobacteriovoraceae bacterium]|tara:strand:+ start:21317 stop:22312 length:996 start_codon:yes stop_codon:yes gene_type:complete
MSYYINPHKFSCPWYPYAQEFGAPNIKWCEESLCSWVSEPANTWSNLAFIIIACLLEYLSRNKERDFDSEFFMKLLFITGFASGIYHASNNYLTQLLDFLAMYTIIFWAIGINLKKLGKLHDGSKFYFFGGFTTLFLVVTHLAYLKQVPIQFLIVVAALIFFYSEWQVKKIANRDYKFLILGSGLIILGEIFSLLDLNRVICEPTNHFFQGHAIWHVLSACGLGAFYFHFAQEVPEKEVSQELTEQDIEEFIEDEIEEEIEEYQPKSKLQTLMSPDEPSWETRESEDITQEHDVEAILNEAKEVPDSEEDYIDPNQLDLFGGNEDDPDKKD